MNEAPSILDLRDVALPESVSMAPQTWGWAVLLVVVLALAGVVVWRLARRHRANRYRRSALAELPACGDAAALARLVKRVCLSAFPRTEVAALSGEAWLRFLDSTVEGAPFLGGPGRALADHYAVFSEATPELTHTVEQWIRRHRART